MNNPDNKAEQPDFEVPEEVKIPDGLFFNILTFEHPHPELKVVFTADFNPQRQRFPAGNLPEEVVCNFYDAAGNPPEHLYAGFLKHDKGFSTVIDPEKYPAVARAYYTRKIRELLVPEVEYHRNNFLNDTQFWCNISSKKNADFHTFQKYTLRVQYDSVTQKPELLLSYDGESYLLRKSMEALTAYEGLNMELITSYAWEGQVYSARHLPRNAYYSQDKLFAVLNRDLARALGISYPYKQVSDNYSRFYREISDFYQHYCAGERFRKIIPHGGQWKRVAEEYAGRISVSGRQLVFGQGGKSTDPYSGLKEFGPLKLPRSKYFGYFFIYREDQEPKARRLYDYLLKKEGFIRMNKLTRLPLMYRKDKNIVLSKNGDAVAEVRTALETASLEEGVDYFAYYISPYTRFERDRQKKSVYYRIKELLLYRRISMQAVEAHKLQGDFSNSVSNIGIALIAKLGGVPWRLEGTEDEELVIGFGAYRNRGFGVQYTGAAVCFRSNGIFREFDVFPAANTSAIAGSAMEAFRSYRERHPDARQITIHFYKKMSRDELEPLEKMLEELDLDIPVVVVGISKTKARSLLAFDRPEKGVMPRDGTWVQTGAASYQLNINRRKTEAATGVKQTLPVKITLQCNREGYLGDRERVEHLLSQLYAFSFLHWRSIRQAPLPVTVTYPSMIASFMPWFRNKILSEHGRTVPWFL